MTLCLGLNVLEKRMYMAQNTFMWDDVKHESKAAIICMNNNKKKCNLEELVQ